MQSQGLPLIALMMFTACSSATEPSAVSAAPEMAVSSAAIYSALAAIPDASYQAAVTQAKSMSLTGYYQALLAATNDSPFAIDGQVFSQRRQILLGYREAYDELAVDYDSVGSYWQALGYDASARPSAAQISSVLKSAASAAGGSGLALTVGTICPQGLATADMPQVGDSINEPPVEPVVLPDLHATKSVLAALPASAPDSLSVYKYQGSYAGTVYALPGYATMGSVRAKTFLDKFLQVLASGTPGPGPAPWHTLSNGVQLKKDPRAQNAITCRQWAPKGAGYPTMEVSLSEDGTVLDTTTFGNPRP